MPSEYLIMIDCLSLVVLIVEASGMVMVNFRKKNGEDGGAKTRPSSTAGPIRAPKRSCGGVRAAYIFLPCPVHLFFVLRSIISSAMLFMHRHSNPLNARSCDCVSRTDDFAVFGSCSDSNSASRYWFTGTAALY